MKLTIIGAAGVRTPLIVSAIIERQERLQLDELALMDIDGERLDIIGALTAPLEAQAHFRITRTLDARAALAEADFVITTFRVGGIESRIVDERVPLDLGVLGQETTGPGGFAMGMRSIPVLLEYLSLMNEVCPHAWLINFANPAGMLAEAAIRAGGWRRTVGICDAPAAMLRVASAVLDAPPEQVYLDYFGLNHLGWVRSVRCRGEDHLPGLIAMIQAAGGLPGLPFDPEFIAALGMIPNEYLFYYYHSRQAVTNILAAGQSRGEQIAALNVALFDDLRQLHAQGDRDGLQRRYYGYLDHRGETYMARETGHLSAPLDPKLAQALAGEGYAGVALNLIEGLTGIQPGVMILNVANRGALPEMASDDVVEIPVYVGKDMLQPLAIGEIPEACLGLMKTVKAYEKLTIAASSEGSYRKAIQALTIHPLVADYGKAKAILDGYIHRHGEIFPKLG